MTWIIAFAKALPVVIISTALVALSTVIGSHSKATGLAALVGMTAEGLLFVGALNVIFGLILWRVVLVWLRV